MSLADLHGYWKYSDVVVPFRLPLAPVRIVAPGYVARKCTADVARTSSLQTRVATVKTSEPEASQFQASGSTEEVAKVNEAGQSQTPKAKRSPTPEKPEQRRFKYEMTAKETVVIKQSISEPAVSTQENEQHLSATSESQDETPEIGKTDSQLEMEQAIL